MGIDHVIGIAIADESDLDSLYPDEVDDEPLGPDDAESLFHDDDIIGKDNPQVETEYRDYLAENTTEAERHMVLAYYLLSRSKVAEAKIVIDEALKVLERDLDFCDKFCVPLANLSLRTSNLELTEKLLMAVPESVRSETPGWKPLLRQLWCAQGKLSTKHSRPFEMPELLLDANRYERSWK